MTKARIQAIPMHPVQEPKGEHDQLMQVVKQDNKQTGVNTASISLFEHCIPPIQDWFLENFENYTKDGITPQQGR